MSSTSARRPAKVPHRTKRRANVSSDDVSAEILGRITAGEKEAVMFVLALLENLTPKLAQAIAGSFGADEVIWLPNIRQLELETARELSRSPAMMSLPGLTQLDSEVAGVLVGKQSVLALDGLTEIDVNTAAFMAGSLGCVSLQGLEKMPAEVAKILAAGSTDIELGGSFLLDNEVLAAFGVGSESAPRGVLGLNGIDTRSLDIPLASSLTAINKDLLLRGVRYVSAKVAAVLGNCRRGLLLPSVYRLEDAALAALARVPGVLDLSGLRGLPAADLNGLRVLAARTQPFHLGRECLLGDSADLLLREAGSLCIEPRSPAAPHTSRASRLHDTKLSWEEREQVAQEICEDVYDAIAGVSIGPFTAPLARWLEERVDQGGSLPLPDRRPAGVGCWDVHYFLAEREAKFHAKGNTLLEDSIIHGNLQRALRWSMQNRPQRIHGGGIGLFKFLLTSVRRQTKSTLRRNTGSRVCAVSLDAVDALAGHSLAQMLPDGASAAPQNLPDLSEEKPGERESSLLARAKAEYTEAERALQTMQSKGGGNLRRAKKIRLEALVWLEWTQESRKRSDDRAETKLTQQEFVRIFRTKYPGLSIDQTRLSRIISARRRKKEASDRSL